MSKYFRIAMSAVRGSFNTRTHPCHACVLNPLVVTYLCSVLIFLTGLEFVVVVLFETSWDAVRRRRSTPNTFPDYPS